MSVVSMVTADLRTWAPVASALFAAFAAGASWRSIALGRAQWRLSHQPYVVGQLLTNQYGVTRLEIRNTGAGAAYGIRFCVITGDQCLVVHPAISRPSGVWG